MRTKNSKINYLNVYNHGSIKNGINSIKKIMSVLKIISQKKIKVFDFKTSIIRDWKNIYKNLL